MKHFYQIFADYHQFYLWDKNAAADAPTNYNEEDIRRRIKGAPHVVVIQPARNTEVPVEVEFFTEPPSLDAAAWDHIAEASLELTSGVLEIHECTGGPIGEFRLSPGTYRVRGYYGKLGEISENGLEGSDHYYLAVWPAAFSAVKVLKQFPHKRQAAHLRR